MLLLCFLNHVAIFFPSLQGVCYKRTVSYSMSKPDLARWLPSGESKQVLVDDSHCIIATMLLVTSILEADYVSYQGT